MIDPPGEKEPLDSLHTMLMAQSTHRLGEIQRLQTQIEALKTGLAEQRAYSAELFANYNTARDQLAAISAVLAKAPLLPFKIEPHGPPIRTPKGPRK